MAFHWNLRDSKSPQVSKTLLLILADLNYSVVWLVFTCPHISKSSSLFTNLMGIVKCALTTSGITVTFTFRCCFTSLANLKCSSVFLLSFNFTPWSAGTALLLFLSSFSRHRQLMEKFDRSLELVWMVSALSPISNYSSPLTKSLEIVPSALITIGITVICRFYSFQFSD